MSDTVELILEDAYKLGLKHGKAETAAELEATKAMLKEAAIYIASGGLELAGGGEPLESGSDAPELPKNVLAGRFRREER